MGFGEKMTYLGIKIQDFVIYWMSRSERKDSSPSPVSSDVGLMDRDINLRVTIK